MRIRGGLMITTHLGVVSVLVRLQAETVLRLPVAAILRALQNKFVLMGWTDPVATVSLPIHTLIERYRLNKAISKADVCQPTLLISRNRQRHVIEVAAELTRFVGHLCGEQGGLKSNLAQ